MRFRQRSRDSGDKNRAEINPDDNPHVCEQTAGSCDHYAGNRRIENVLHFGVGWHEALQEKKHLMELRRIGAEETEQMPEKKETRREGEKKQIRHLRCQASGGIGRRFPNQTAQDSPDKSEIFHRRPEFTLPDINIH